MKKLSSIILIAAFTIASGQAINDFEYIYVPKELEKKINEYDLDKILIKNLNSKKYKTIQDNVENWPTELQFNKCLVAKANILDDSSFLRNKIKVQFKDCNDKVILEAKGTSSEKDYNLGFKDALSQSLKTIPLSSPKALTAVTQQAGQVSQNTGGKSVELLVTKAELYTNGSQTYQRINLEEGQFILANTNSPAPFASFKETAKKDVYRVRLQNGASTIGYLENNNIVIEIINPDDTISKEIFQRK